MKIKRSGFLWVSEEFPGKEYALEELICKAILINKESLIIVVNDGGFLVDELLIVHQASLMFSFPSFSIQIDYNGFIYSYSSILKTTELTVLCVNSSILRSGQRKKVPYVTKTNELLIACYISFFKKRGELLTPIMDNLNSLEIFGKQGRRWKLSNISQFIDKYEKNHEIFKKQ